MKTIGLLVLTFILASVCFAQDAVLENVVVAAVIPQQSSLSVTVSKVTGTTWTPVSSLEFGNLNYDEANGIFTSDSYFVVDVGILANSPSWSVKFDATSITNGSVNLDNNVNVTFMKQVTSTDPGERIAYLSYADSKGKSFVKNAISPGWLRIYFGIATGDPANPDAPGVSLLTVGTYTVGNYNGNINVTLIP